VVTTRRPYRQQCHGFGTLNCASARSHASPVSARLASNAGQPASAALMPGTQRVNDNSKMATQAPYAPKEAGQRAGRGWAGKQRKVSCFTERSRAFFSADACCRQDDHVLIVSNEKEIVRSAKPNDGQSLVSSLTPVTFIAVMERHPRVKNKPGRKQLVLGNNAAASSESRPANHAVLVNAVQINVTEEV